MKKERDENLMDEESRVEIETDNKVVQAQQFIFNNGKMLAYIVLGVAAAIVAIVWLNKSMTESQTKETNQAMVALDRIYKFYDAPDYKKALFGDSSQTVRGQRVIGLIEIIDEFNGTPQAEIAAFYAGNSYLALSKSDEAIEYFEMATGSSSKTVLQGAFAGLGACFEIKKDFDKAASYYTKASDLAVDDVTKARYGYYAALSYEKAGNTDMAVDLYTNISNKHKFNEFGNYSKAGLVRLGMKIE